MAPVASGATWRLLVGLPRRDVVLVDRRRLVHEVAVMTAQGEAALYYGELGLRVFPCEVRGKRPLTAHGCKDASDRRSHIWSWWQRHPSANIGIACGPGGWLVVDLDGAAGEASWAKLTDQHGQVDTLEQTTGRGRHLVFEHPTVELGNTAGRLGRGIDTRSSGGYVIVAPSVHPSGRLYEWVWPEEHPAASGNGNSPPAPFSRRQWHLPRGAVPAPGWAVEELQAPPAAWATGRTRVAPVIVGAIPERLPRHLADRVRESPAGDRSAQCYRLVLAAIEWGLDDGATVALALAHAPTVAKYGARAAAEVGRILGRVRPDHPHVGKPCDRAACHHRPDWMR